MERRERRRRETMMMRIDRYKDARVPANYFNFIIRTCRPVTASYISNYTRIFRISVQQLHLDLLRRFPAYTLNMSLNALVST